MADNFLNNSFGMNIKIPERTLKQMGMTAQGAANGLWEPLFTFLDENKNIFNGNVANQIEKYNLMMFNIGAALREGNTNGDFNVQA